MKYRRVKKKQGKSWIEVKGKVYMFLAEDRRHERQEEIKLAELMEKIDKLGQVPVWDEMLLGVMEKREALWYPRIWCGATVNDWILLNLELSSIDSFDLPLVLVRRGLLASLEEK
ncbi:hypothetical protein GH714_005425 [Hevea brasiliensis]|uniref:Uncharacterized protein n=1 Tax=Hevea brasiliensis TaxID=3981 RepID=A0A6A6KDH6_HEVBR|nr:hypothetical protein GH714_005425 [Hevea brasiliensis]